MTEPNAGLLGKLLLPAYTDAGASTSFQAPGPGETGPSATSLSTSANHQDPDHNGSEAGTEIRDNRTSAAKEQFRKNNLQRKANASHNKSPIEESPQKQPTTTGLLHSPTRKPAFFPTTQPAAASGAPAPAIASRPESPPEISRNSLPTSSSATSLAGTSVVPEIGGIDFTVEIEKENRTRFPFHNDDDEGDSTTKEGKSNQSLPTLNAENLQKVAKATDQESTDSSRSRANRESSLLTEEEATGSDVDLASDVNSTASEMGTVIEIGNHAKRMAEVEAMAAMIDEQFDQQMTPRSEGFPPAPSRTPTSRKGPETVAALALPTLETTKNNSNRPTTPLQNAPKTAEIFEGKKNPLAVNPKATAMISSAIRRINSGINNALSAPPTPKTPGVVPPKVEELLRSTLTPRGSTKEPPIGEQDDLPPSLALRSPGSSARVFLSRRAQGKDHPRPILKPRFTSSMDDKPVHRSKSMDSGINLDSKPSASASLLTVPKIQLQPLKLSHMSPFRIAEKCMSFDSADDLAESTTSSQVMKLETSLPMRRTQYDKSPMATHMGIKAVASWDVGGASAFRAEPHRSHRIAGMEPTKSQQERDAQRKRVHSDFSPLKAAGGKGYPNTIELQTPQRVMDVEREDALDILACLVERGVTSWKEDPEGDSSSRDKGEGTSNSETLVAGLVEELRSSLSDETSNGKEMQIAALDELLKSHGYALEMKRAALSAAGWLKSIGRGAPIEEGDEASSGIHMPIIQEPSEVGQASGEDAASDKQSCEDSVSGSVDYKMEMLTLRARLHSTEQELREKSEVAQKLDVELSKCRAEIGRLLISTRTEPNTSQSRSILDDGSVTEGDPLKESAPPIARQDTEDEEKKFFDDSFQGDNSLFQDVSVLVDETSVPVKSENADVKALKAALEEANATIRRLHEKVKTEVEEGEPEEPPTVSMPDTSTTSSPEESTKKGPSSPGDEHRTVNVRMLDGENFVTEWDELRPPLPPPPDHGLRSPIVNAVLEQWTTDRGLHASLLAWIDRVMTGDDLESSVPPLTIQSLDHQVRDGFIMHVLPLLLRRADIHVAVQTRAHRRTTYDMAVTVQQKTLSAPQHPGPNHAGQSLLDYHVNDEWIEKFDPISSADSVAHSAVTEHIGNTAARSNGTLRNHDDEEGYSHFGIPHPMSADGDDAQQPTIMGALGGALGGLLSRSKYSAAHSPSRFHDASASIPTRGSMDQMGPSLPAGDRMAELDDQPYHRVVSAPPGRIGMTFVELRGHAVVSDVAPDSPLSSWVFPSDILIAVDEVPVSGMRVRDIIKVLTNRKDRQRALRVISSHAMNEFTLNQSALADEPT